MPPQSNKLSRTATPGPNPMHIMLTVIAVIAALGGGYYFLCMKPAVKEEAKLTEPVETQAAQSAPPTAAGTSIDKDAPASSKKNRPKR